ncbi:MAG TPA: hypothetical protein VGW74_09355 [Propionibacteriaceae bacterium]|nr:hypothetical protein [Propionibacteriaceae bacterium]
MRLRRQPAFDVAAYIERVADVLADEFEWDDTTRSIFTQNVPQAIGPGRWVEFTCDDPASARFRLRNAPTGNPYELRVGFYPVAPVHDPDHPGEVRARAITARLAEALEEG